MRGEGFAQARNELLAQLPTGHLAFLRQTGESLVLGDFFFCHAGVRPGVPLEAQTAADLLWIRDEFLDATENFGRVVVHGHTPVPEPDFRANRINLDTGAYATGRLTCLVLEGDGARFI
jgi:serine/threonine protein phosphatase 1